MGQQNTQPHALHLGQPFGAPAEALDVAGQPSADGRGHPAADHVKVPARRHDHNCLSS